MTTKRKKKAKTTIMTKRINFIIFFFFFFLCAFFLTCCCRRAVALALAALCACPCIITFDPFHSQCMLPTTLPTHKHKSAHCSLLSFALCSWFLRATLAWCFRSSRFAIW